MRGPGRGTGGGARGFIASEMILLLLILVAFLAGVVLLVDRGVSTFDSSQGDRSLTDESERIFDGLDAILGSSRAVSLEQTDLDPAFNRARLVLVTDLDGTGGGGTGEIDSSEVEIVGIGARRDRPGELQVLVTEEAGGAREAVLSSMLDGARGAPFAVEYRAPDGEKIGPSEAGNPVLSVGSIRVRLWVRSGSWSRSFSRVFELEEPLPAAPVGQDLDIP